MLYDYKCPDCGRIEKDVLVKDMNEEVKCIQCHEKMHRLFPLFAFHDYSKGIFLEHVSAKGETFHSKKEMQKYAKEHNLELGALL